MSKLVIVESPAKCKKIEQYLGSPYNCMASYGHFRNCKSLKKVMEKKVHMHLDHKDRR